MNARQLPAFCIAVGLAACKKEGPPSPSPLSQPPPAPTSTTAASATPAAEPVAGAGGLAPKEGVLSGLVFDASGKKIDGMPSVVAPLTRFGFTPNGSFGACSRSRFTVENVDAVDENDPPFVESAGPEICVLAPRDSARSKEPILKGRSADLKATSRLPSSNPRTWRWGGRLQIAVKVDVAKLTVSYGASLDGGEPVYPIKLAWDVPKAKREAAEGSTKVASYTNVYLSEDGGTLGALGSFDCVMDVGGNEESQCGATLLPFSWDVDRFAAAVVQEFGYRAYGKKDFAEAQKQFALAAATAPGWELPSYNEACAAALAGDAAGAERSLRAAIERGGDSVKLRATKDKDFRVFASTTWFSGLTR